MSTPQPVYLSTHPTVNLSTRRPVKHRSTCQPVFRGQPVNLPTHQPVKSSICQHVYPSTCYLIDLSTLRSVKLSMNIWSIYFSSFFVKIRKILFDPFIIKKKTTKTKINFNLLEELLSTLRYYVT